MVKYSEKQDLPEGSNPYIKPKLDLLAYLQSLPPNPKAYDLDNMGI